ncbi:MAG: hypothetical protein JW909_07565 [Planctomycetes bacterium]|nr:hypothetical protein [Planctomycetota bacterium]
MDDETRRAEPVAPAHAPHVRRTRAGAWPAAAVLFLVIGFIGGRWWGTRQADGLAEQLASARDETRRLKRERLDALQRDARSQDPGPARIDALEQKIKDLEARLALSADKAPATTPAGADPAAAELAALEERARSPGGRQATVDTVKDIDDFIARHPDTEYAARAERLKYRISEARMWMFEEDARQPNALAAQYRFAEAMDLFGKIGARYEGTRWTLFAEMRRESIQAQKALHDEVVRLIKAAAADGREPVLEFDSPGLPAGRMLVLDARDSELVIALESDRRLRKTVQWAAVSPADVYAVYRACIPEPTAAQHNQLGLFCQERDLIDKAEEHFARAEE